MRHLAACTLLLAVASADAGEVEVRFTAAGRLSLRVTSAPLSEVLSRLAQQTGMKVMYDGAPPRALVRGRQVEDATPAEAVADVLEGLGVAYALRLDATGARVETLLVLGAVRAAAPPAPRPSAPPPVRYQGLTNVPVTSPEADDDEPSGEDPSVDQRTGTGRGEDRELRRPGPPVTIPTVPTFPIGPINPLTMPTPAPSPAPTPPPQ